MIRVDPSPTAQQGGRMSTTADVVDTVWLLPSLYHGRTGTPRPEQQVPTTGMASVRCSSRGILGLMRVQSRLWSMSARQRRSDATGRRTGAICRNLGWDDRA